MKGWEVTRETKTKADLLKEILNNLQLLKHALPILPSGTKESKG